MPSAPKPLRHLAWILGAALACHAPLAGAGMIGPEAAMGDAAPSQSDLDRAKVQQFLDQATVKERLQAMGVGALNARERVAALAPAEVHALAQRIDALPAGGALSNTDLIIVLLIAVLVVLVL
jgi:hypothetical protein